MWLPSQAFRLHFSDAALAQVQALSLDQDAVRTVLHQGSKLQLGENRLVCRHRGIEVEAEAFGADVEVLEVRREARWPSRAPALPYLKRFGGA